MTREEMFARARRETERRRQDAEGRALQHKAQLYAKVPQLQALDDRIADTGAAAGKLSAMGLGEEARQKLAELETYRQEKEALLGQLGSSEAALAPRYSCPLCHDSGNLNGGVCRCIHRQVQQMQRQEINDSSLLPQCHFSNFSLEYYPQRIEGTDVSPRGQMQQILEYCQSYAQGFSLADESLFMYGNAGLGKTHLALSIAGEVLDKGFHVVYVSAPKAFTRIEQDRRDWNADDSYYQSLLGADLLIMDDLGTEHLTAYTQTALYDLVNSRMGRRPTIYTTNIDSAALLEQRYTEKIASRLLGACQQMPFLGVDIRLQKHSM